MDRETSHSTLQQRFGRRSGARRHDRKSSGFGRVLIVVYWVFSLSAGVRSTFSAAVYVVATVALSRSGTRWHRVATAAVLVELVGVLGVGLLSVLHPELFPKASVWSDFGAGYGYIPLVLPVVGLAWLWVTRPSRAER